LPAALGLAACGLATLALGVIPGHIINLANRGAGAILNPVSVAVAAPVSAPPASSTR